jgi:hypothetical protein
MINKVYKRPSSYLKNKNNLIKVSGHAFANNDETPESRIGISS